MSAGPYHAISRRLMTAGALALLAGCSGSQSALDPRGPQSGHIERLWWLYFWVAVGVYVLVMLTILWAVARRTRRRQDDPPELHPPESRERGLAWTVGIATAVTTAILFVLLGGDFATGRSLHAIDDPEAMPISVVGRQWWWEVQYLDETPSEIVTTANEIHIPVGRPVKIELSSPDVIHSFWVPNLHGKRDLIPGHPTQIFLRADRAGEYGGQCAEFCGLQHAHMRFVVVAQPQQDFDSWLAAQRRPAPQPTTESEKRGKEVFLKSTCILCHAIQGTSAFGRVGPNLTHVASRPLIAGALPNTRGNLAGWIANPQSIKPGVRMPPNPLPSEDLNALLDYLQSLK